MKKIIMGLFLLICSVGSVYAKDNKLYFTESGNRLFYESSLLDENIFMKHIDMIPGSSYRDELLIENGTNTKYTLYFKVIPREQSVEADELLESIIMKITLDDKIIYDGKAMGLDYTNQGVNLQDVILLGDFTPSKNVKMVVDTKLSESYDNIDNHELSYIDWSFYAQYDNSKPPVEIIPSPNTMKNSFPFMTLFSVVIVFIGLGMVKYGHKAKK